MNRLRLLCQHRMVLTLVGQSIFSVKFLMICIETLIVGQESRV